MAKKARNVIMVDYHDLKGKVRRATIEVRQLPSGKVIFADGNGQSRWPADIWSWFEQRAKEEQLI